MDDAALKKHFDKANNIQIAEELLKRAMDGESLEYIFTLEPRIAELEAELAQLKRERSCAKPKHSGVLEDSLAWIHEDYSE